ncbi:hypothetical protein D3C78_1945870 [compost metagenome]
MLIGETRVMRFSTVITGQLGQVSWLRAGGRQVAVDALTHTFEVRSETRIIEAIAGISGID